MSHRSREKSREKSKEKYKEKEEAKSSIAPEDLEKLLNEFSKIKQQISQLEQKEKKMKLLIEDIMRDDGTNRLDSENYTITKRSMKRSQISQKDVPSDIWSKYSKTSEFSVLYLKRY